MMGDRAAGSKDTGILVLSGYLGAYWFGQCYPHLSLVLTVVTGPWQGLGVEVELHLFPLSSPPAARPDIWGAL